MRRVALVIGSGDPTSGGGHTFVKTVLNGLDQIGVKNLAFKIVVIGQEIDVNRLVPNKFCTSVIKVKSPRFVPGKLIRKLSLKKALSQKNSVIEALNEFDFVFFLGCEVLQTEVPFGFVLWDLQHMTDPFFPEVGQLQVWNSREQSSQLALRRSSLVVTGTEVGKEQIVKYYGVDEKHIEIIPHPVKYNEIFRTSVKGTKSNFLTLFYPAQFWAHKNHVMLVKVAKKLKDDGYSNFQFVLTGSDKGNKEYVIDCIQQYGVTELFKVYGFVSEEKLEQIYSETDALVYPSYSGPENLPPLEAIVRNIPVMISDYPGAREQLGGNASYFNPNNSAELVDLIKAFSEQPESFLLDPLEVRKLFEKRNGSYFASALLSILGEKMILRDTWR